jgi:hypothetical protein
MTSMGAILVRTARSRFLSKAMALIFGWFAPWRSVVASASARLGSRLVRGGLWRPDGIRSRVRAGQRPGNMWPFGIVALPFEAAGGVVGAVTAPINPR